ncbi:MAG TPA: alpha/beta hydrolase [Thermoanaerobaculia bacterium]|nr:alpha/beta hydrolase [Thermoanaerobaculia bacterium]
MKRARLFAIAALIALPCLAAAPAEEPAELKTPTGTLYGTLLVPPAKAPVPVVLLISGSGPTDRNGNSAALPGANDSLKMLAEGLAANGIASLRYDKRGIAASREAMTAEKDLRFDTYVDDAAAWTDHLAHERRFSSVIIAGHSEGALIGLLAAERGKAAAYVSIAGVGRPASAVLRDQLAGKLPPDLAKFNDQALAALESGKTIGDVPPALAALYRPSVQPYLISWFRYDPAAEIRKLKIPVLIIQGTTDIQVGVADARALAAAHPGANLQIIEGMNHVLKMVEPAREKQIASYSDPSLPVATRLIEGIAAFVHRSTTKAE